MATFVNRPTATIKANFNGQSGQLSIGGVTTVSMTQETAAAQINKILAIVNKSVVAHGMTRTFTQDGGES